MRKLAHIGIPVKEKRPNSEYLEVTKLYLTDPAKSKNKVEFLCFQPGCPMPKICQEMTHIAYEVDSLEEELKGAEVIIEPFNPFPNVKCAFIVEEGMPIELMEVSK